MTKRGTAFKSALLLSGTVLISIGHAGAAWAQDAESAEESEAAEGAGDEIVVTGTRLRGVAPVGSAMIGVTRDVIEQSNAVTTTQLLQELPQVYNLGISEASRGQSGGAFNTTYGTSINIRGIGPFATLTLIDSARSTPQGSTGYAVDPSVIPTLAIERVEVIADGASAIYGSDAVAGVANVILRRGFDGVTVSGRYGFGRQYEENQVGFIAGKNWGSGQLTVSAERQFRDNLNGRDRDYFVADQRALGGADYRATTCNPGNIVVGGVSYAIPTGGVTPANASSLVANTQNKCDVLKVIDLMPQQRRTSGVFTFNQDLTDWFRITANGFISERVFELARDATFNNLTVPATNAFFVRPAGTTGAVSVQYSFDRDYGQQTQSGFSRTRQISAGFEADWVDDWQLSANFVMGRNFDYTTTTPTPVAARLTAALASNNPATAFDPFGLNRTSTATLNDILSGVTSNAGKTRFRDLQIQMDGSLFTLPGGNVRLAGGFESQYQRINPTNLSGSAANPLVRTKVRTRTVHSFFSELFVPIFGEDNATPGFNRLELNLAGRYDDYSDVGDTWNPKIGVNYEPFEGLTLHGSYGTSFRAPTLSQLYGTGGGVFALIVQNYSDPVSNSVRPGVTSSGENPNLVPEEATTYSFGLDVEPTDSLTFSVNYFDIFYSNQIQAYVSDTTLLGREDQFAGTGIITRNPTAAFLESLNAIADQRVNMPANAAVYVDGRSRNAGDTKARGLDFQLNYHLPTEGMGEFDFRLSGSYFLEYKTSIATGGRLVDVLNTIFQPLRFRSRADVAWNSGPVQAGLTMNYVNSYSNNLVTPVERVSDYVVFDARVFFDLSDVTGMNETRLGVDVRNLFDTDPTYVNVAQSRNGGGGYDPSVGSPLGRVVSVSLVAGF